MFCNLPFLVIILRRMERLLIYGIFLFVSRLREAIKDASMVELKDFLETIRKYSPKIGEMAMRATAVRLSHLSSTSSALNAAANLMQNNVAENSVASEPKKQMKLAPQPNPFTG